MSILKSLLSTLNGAYSRVVVTFLTASLLLGVLTPALTLADQDIRLIGGNSVEFADTVVGQTTTKSRSFRNETNTALTVQLLRTTNPYFNSVSKEVVVGAGKTVEFKLSFTPNTIGKFRGEFLFGVEGREQRIKIDVEGVGTRKGTDSDLTLGNAGPFEVLADVVDFGEVYVRDQRKDRVLVRNLSNNLITVQAFKESNVHFKLLGKSVFDVAPGDIYELPLSFSPRLAGKKSAYLQLVSGENTAMVKLQGRGLAAAGQSQNFTSTLKIQNNKASAVVNPINGDTAKIDFSLNNSAQVNVTIQKGNEVVRTLVNYGNVYTAGKIHTLTWDGRSDAGQVLPVGTYRYVIDAYSPKLGTDVAYGQINVIDATNSVGTGFANIGTNFVLQDKSLGNQWKVAVSQPATVVIAVEKDGKVVEVVDQFFAVANTTFVRNVNLATSLGNGVYEYTINAIGAGETLGVRGTLIKTADDMFVTKGVDEPIVDVNENLVTFLSLDKSYLETSRLESVVGSFYLNKESFVTVEVVNINGNVKRTLLNGRRLSAGLHENIFTWNAKDLNGEFVNAGTYYVNVKARTVANNPELKDEDSTFVLVDKLPFLGATDVESILNDLEVSPSTFNPSFGESLNINFVLAKPATVQISVVDDKNHFVTFVARDLDLKAGNHKYTYSGRDYFHHELIGNGQYTILVSAKSKTSIDKDKDRAAFAIGQPLATIVTVGDNRVNLTEFDKSEDLQLSHNLTRAEAIAFLNAFNLTKAKYNPLTDGGLGFADLENTGAAWLLSPFKTFIKTAALSRFNDQGIILKEMVEGYIRPNVVLPNQLVTQAEFYKMIVEGLNNQVNGTSLVIDRNPKDFCFADVKKVNSTVWYLPYAKFVCNELVNTPVANYHTQGFSAGSTVTLEQAFTVLQAVKSKGWF